MDAEALAQLEALLRPEGEAVLVAAMRALAPGDGGRGGSGGGELAVGTRLRAAGMPPELVAAAFTQAELRYRASGKFALAERMLFTRAGLEQSSSQAAADHRAARFAGLGAVADLCTGIGGDAMALAPGRDLLLVDRDPVHLRLAEHNVALAREALVREPPADLPASAGGLPAPPGGLPASAGRTRTLLADVRAADLEGMDGVFIDPARRVGDRRLASRSSEPPLSWCFGLADRVAAIAVKAAPGLDTALVPLGWEIEFVADGRDLKEAVLFSPALATASRRATVLPSRVLPAANGPAAGGSTAKRPAAGGSDVGGLNGGPDASGPCVKSLDAGGPGSGFGGGGAQAVSLTGVPDRVGVDGTATDGADGSRPAPPDRIGAYLYDPSPAVTRASLVGELARRLGAWQVDPMIAFLTSDEPVPTPFARLLRIEADLPFDVRRLAALLRTRGVGSVDVRRRGLAGDVEEIRRRLVPRRRDLVPGGPAVTVMMTRRQDAPWAFVCTEVPPART